MKMILPVYLDQLKTRVLITAGIRSVAPSDCKVLAYQVSQKTNKPLSDTTLKRVFGFANAGFNPSLYTLNALAEYCGETDWEAFCHRPDDMVTRHPQVLIPSLAQLVSRISKRTLETLMNNSGIPYHLTIKRKFVFDHLDDFLEGDDTVTLFTAPAGYGKTIALCHWMEDRLNKLESDAGSDMVLLLSSKTLSGVPHNGSGLDNWLNIMLGFSQDSNSLAEKIAQHLETSRFYLVIDGFDRERFKADDYELLTELLLDMVDLYRTNPNFKLILSMRLANWSNLSSRLLVTGKTTGWHLGFMQAGAAENDIPLFTLKEIETFCSRFGAAPDIRTLEPEAISFFGYPLALQYYYQKYRQRPDALRLDHFGIYEVISSYFLDKIYTSRRAADKIILLNTLLDNGMFFGGNFRINKLKVHTALKEFREDFHELLNTGFIQVVNNSSEGKFSEYIELPYKRLLAYCLARKLVYENGELYDQKLMTRIAQLDESHRVHVLKWCVFNAVKVRQLAVFSHLTELGLSPEAKANFLKFFNSLLANHYLPADDTGSYNYLYGHRLQALSFYLGMEFLSPDYEQLLKQLVVLPCADQAILWLRIALAAVCLVQLNLSGLEQLIRELQAMDPQLYYPFLINPLDCVKTLYYYLRDGSIHKEALRQITAYTFHPGNEENLLPEGLEHFLQLLALSCLSLSGSPAKQLRFIDALARPSLPPELGNDAFITFLLLAKTAALLDAGRQMAAEQCYKNLFTAMPSQDHSLTPYLRLTQDLVQVRLLLSRNELQDACRLVERLMPVAANLKYNYLEALMSTLCLEQAAEVVSAELRKQLNYRMMKLVAAGGFDPSSIIRSARRPRAVTKVAV